MPTVSIAAKLANYTYKATTVGEHVPSAPGWTVLQILDRRGQGGNYTVVFGFNNGTTRELFFGAKGTNPTQSSNILTDLEVFFGTAPTGRVTDLVNIIDQYRNQPQYADYAISTGGHSLGALVAALASMREYASGFNLPALAEDSPTPFYRSSSDANVLAISATGDWVGHYGVGFNSLVNLDTNAPRLLGLVPEQFAKYGDTIPIPHALS